MTVTIARPRTDWLNRLRTIMVLRPGQRVAHLPGVGVSVSRRAVSSAETTVVLNPSKDTLLNDTYPLRNYGATEPMNLWGSSTVYLFGFDLSSIPSSSSCLQASFSVYTLNTRTSNRYMHMYELTAANGDWPEGTKAGVNAGVGDCSWDYKDHGLAVAWAGSAGCQTPGTDYVNTLLGTVTYPANAAPGRFTATINAAGCAALAASFGSTFTFYGSAIGFTVGWYTRSNTDAALRPQLEITYN